MSSDKREQQDQHQKPLPYAHKGDLTSGSIPRHLIRLTLPMAWGIMAVISVQLVDTYFVGLLSDKHLAAISFTFPVTLTLTHLMFGFPIAMSSVIARLIGANDHNKAGLVIFHGLMCAIGLYAFIALLCYVFMPHIFAMLQVTDDVYSIIAEYIPLWLLGSVILVVPMNANAAIRAGGDTFKPALVMTLSALTNAILDPILIFGHFGFPAMGVKGAAVATLCGYMLASLLALYYLIADKKLLNRACITLSEFNDSMKRLAFIALPAGLTNTVMPIIGGFVTSVLAVQGVQAVAAYGVATRIEAFAMLFVMALSTAMAPIIGQNWGAGNKARVKDTIYAAIKFNIVWSFAIATILAVFGRAIASVFTDDPVIIHTIIQFFWIIPITFGIGNLVFGWASAFNAIGRPVNALVMIVMRAAITVPFVWIGSSLDGTRGVFIALAAVNIITGAAFHLISTRQCAFHKS